MKGGIAIGFLLVILSSCYYDKAEELYPPGNCDTLTVGWNS